MHDFYDRNLPGVLWVGFIVCITIIWCGVYGS